MYQKEIVLIDDRDYGLRQIKNAIPESKKALYKVTYYPSVKEYQSRHLTKSHIVLLDFFLSKDGKYGHKIVNEINADIIIGFSSYMKASLAIIDSVKEEEGDLKKHHVYAVQKLKRSDHNPVLAEHFTEVL